jgi:uncharacterized protein YicC (UPF0701 family)
MHDLCHILESRPARKPKTLVAAMINVAVQGLYVSTINEGFRLNEWRDQDLVALQQQLGEVDLLSEIHSALNCEVASISRTFETIELGMIFDSVDSKRKLSLRRLMYSSVARGWVDLNLVYYTHTMDALTECFDATNQVLFPERSANSAKKIMSDLKRSTPYNFIAVIAIPNCEKAFQSVSENQTKINQGALACALDRFKNARGHYPESLEELKPEFIAAIPHDVIGGKPLHYRRTSDKFALYSIGWNQTDDGGTPSASRELGDWVWEN